MGIRSDRKIARIKRLEESKTVLPGGILVLPHDYMYQQCITCEHHCECCVSNNRELTVYASMCRKRFRNKFEVEKFESVLEKNKSKRIYVVELSEKCSKIMTILMDDKFLKLFD